MQLSDIEAVVAQAWRETLGTDDFTHDDPFFDVGGDSMKLAMVFHRVRERLDVPGLSLLDVFSNPTVRGYAEHVRRHLAGSAG
ncbi:acyl carrier protein [Micromonospora sp. URMC 107]|uniref:acyl carrier protein n=1 Tax=Micromonospora sp. URMC 107 TaxID=3423418 RepID=UPI003F1DE379